MRPVFAYGLAVGYQKTPHCTGTHLPLRFLINSGIFRYYTGETFFVDIGLLRQRLFWQFLASTTPKLL